MSTVNCSWLRNGGTFFAAFPAGSPRRGTGGFATRPATGATFPGQEGIASPPPGHGPPRPGGAIQVSTPGGSDTGSFIIGFLRKPMPIPIPCTGKMLKTI